MSKAKDLKDQSTGALEDNLQTLMKEMFELRGLQLDAKTPKTHLISQKRRDIARIKTILRERELTQ